MSVDVGLFLQGQLGTSGNNTHWAYPGAVPKNLDHGNFFGAVSTYLRVGDRIFLPRAELTVTEQRQNTVRVALMKAAGGVGEGPAPSTPPPAPRTPTGKRSED